MGVQLLVSTCRFGLLWTSALVFLFPLNRRPHFIRRVTAWIAIGAAAQILWRNLYVPEFWPEMAVYYAFVVILFYRCADITLMSAFYCGIWTMMGYLLSVQVVIDTLRGGMGQVSMLGLCLCLVSILLTAHLLVGMTLARWMPHEGEYQIGPRQLLSALIILIIALTIVWQANMMQQENMQWNLSILVESYCATLLYLQHELFRKSAIEQELLLVNQMWEQHKRQYDLAKENIALINQKSHDLKHQIRAMQLMYSDTEREKYIREIEESVQIYETIAQTGNEVLDTVLTEKSLYCRANRIQANCVADGSLLSFMDPVDLYTIFANALDNAIECVCSYEDMEKRMIDVLVYAEKKMLVIQVINPTEHRLKLDAEGFPDSTKVKDGYHGFGLRSIRQTAEKYHGFSSMKEKNGFFYLQILLPLQEL